MTCDHRWFRMPIVDFSLMWACTQCKIRTQICMTAANADKTLEQLDEMFVQWKGGIFVSDSMDLFRSEMGLLCLSSTAATSAARR